MDIYSAESTVKNLLRFVTEASDTQDVDRMYEKSKVRWRSLAKTCIDVVEVISNMLEEELLVSSPSYEDDEGEMNIDEILKSMRREIEKLEGFSSPKQSIATLPSTKENAKAPKIDSDTRRLILSGYRNVLSTLSVPKEFPSAIQCGELLARWLEIRFFDSIKSNTSFRYNIRRIPKWIYDIVIVYGRYAACGQEAEFISQFNAWLDTTYGDTKPATYAIPYVVYQFDTSPKPEDITLYACVLFDILLNSGLSTMCSDADGYLRDTGVYQLCEKYNPEVLDNYTNYQFNPQIINFVGLGGEQK